MLRFVEQTCRKFRLRVDVVARGLTLKDMPSGRKLMQSFYVAVLIPNDFFLKKAQLLLLRPSTD